VGVVPHSETVEKKPSLPEEKLQLPKHTQSKLKIFNHEDTKGTKEDTEFFSFVISSCPSRLRG